MAGIFGAPRKMDVIVWEWTNDRGDWSAYEALVSNYIEDNTSKGLVYLRDVDSNLSTLAVDIARMVQISHSGIERPVRREIYDADSAVACGAIWQWRGEQKGGRYVWLPYSMEVANLLEASYNRDPYGQVDLDVSPFNEPYIVDMGQKLQINKTSGFARPIQRLLTSANYKTVSDVRQSWQRYIPGWFPAGNPSAASSSSGFGSIPSSAFSTGSSVPFAAYGSGSSSSLGSSASNGFGSTAQPGSGGYAQPGFGNSVMPQFGGGASQFSNPTPNAPSGISSSSGASGSGFTFAAPFPGPSLSSHNPSSSWNSAPSSVAMTSFSSPSLASTSAPQRPMRRVRKLKTDTAPGLSSNHSSAGAMDFSFQPPSSSGFSFDMNGPGSSVQQSSSATASFAGWRDSSASPNHISNRLSSQANPPMPPPYASGGAAAYSTGNNSSGLISSLISGFTNMVVMSYRYVTTGGNSNQSVSTNASVVPASAASAASSAAFAAPPAIVMTDASKPGARSIGGTYRNAKRLKIHGDEPKTTSQDDLTHIQKLTAKDVLQKYIKDVPKPPAHEDCCICCDSLREASGYGQGNSYLVVQLAKCSHMFHMDCISAMYDSASKNGSIQCPNCKTIYGVKYGNCPNGSMECCVLPQELPGYKGCSTIQIRYNIVGGIQTEVHPNPGRPYKIRGFPRTCYLPNNQEGQKVLALLEVAWKRRLTFTVGTSVTTGEPDVVVWNEIHHKTDMNNASGHGYPDPNYINNVLAELEAQGVTDDDK